MIEYRAGAVWWGSIDFNDGIGERKKYVVLLNDCDQDGEQALAAVTTSRSDRYDAGSATGSPCSATGRCFRIDGGQEKCFPVDTLVQFDNSNLVSRAGLEKAKQQGRAGFIQTLNEERVRSLLNCAKKSSDIVKRDLERIERALKARAAVKKPPPPKVTTPSAPRAYVSAEILSVSVEVGRFCGGCRTELAALVDLSEADLTATLHGTKQAPADFVKNATACCELLAEQRAKCAECAKGSATA